MRYVVEAGTDAGSLALFDPGALPEDFERRARKDPFEVWAEVNELGTAFWINTDGDGGYLLHAYVDDPIPSSLEAYVRDPWIVESFKVPSGELYFTGVEYGFRNDKSFLRKHPHMGSSFTVRTGVYRTTVWRTEYPEGLQEGQRRKQVTALTFYLHKGMGWFVWLAVLGVIVLAITAWCTHLSAWFWYLMPLWSVMVLAPILVARLSIYKRADERFRAIAREFPSIVAQLEFVRQS